MNFYSLKRKLGIIIFKPVISLIIIGIVITALAYLIAAIEKTLVMREYSQLFEEHQLRS